MNQITSIKALPSQSFKIPLPKGTIKFTLNYKPSIMMWFMDVTYNTFIVNSIKISNKINCLEQFSNVIPFGVFVMADNGLCPFLIDDFSSGRVQFYLMDETDILDVNTFYKAG